MTGTSDIADPADPTDAPGQPLLIVTGLSGAGLTTAVKALEDLGYETINSFPISLLGPLIEPVQDSAPAMAVSIGAGSRGFSSRALLEAVAGVRARWQAGVGLVFLDCADERLLARFSETRRRHPRSPGEDPATGIKRERALLADVQDAADTVIDTTHLTPHELRAELGARYALDRAVGLAITLQSFSYKRGTPAQADMVIDCRFLRNPYWDDDLRALDGRDPRVQGFVQGDPRYDDFLVRLREMVLMLLPAYKAEGKTHFCIGLGCTGGRHRSVTVVSELSDALVSAGWHVAIRHRELDRMTEGARP